MKQIHELLENYTTPLQKAFSSSREMILGGGFILVALARPVEYYEGAIESLNRTWRLEVPPLSGWPNVKLRFAMNYASSDRRASIRRKPDVMR